jgi:choline-sulfatase
MAGSGSQVAARALRLVALAVGGLVVAASLGIQGCTRGNGRNVVLVVVDTVRADRLSLYEHQRNTSPALERWAAEGAVFETALATSSWTLPSFGSILTGRLPSRHGAGMRADPDPGFQIPQLDASVVPLAQILERDGYATGAIVNNPWLHPGFGLSRGFDTYDFDPGDDAHIRRADVVVDRSLAWVDASHGRPFFLLVHFFDPHMPYDAPPPARGRFTRAYPSRLALPFRQLEAVRTGRLKLGDVDRDFVRAAYDEELLFVDMQLDRLLGGLRERHLLDHTIVFFTADHGEELFDHGGFEHGHTMYQELLHVPFVVWGPGVRAGRSSAIVSIADIFPTVLEALGLPPVEGLAGVSLWGALTQGQPLPERELVAEGILYGSEKKALVRWPYKTILDMATRSRRLYDLSSDPTEQVDLAPRDPARADALVRDLMDRVRTAVSERGRQQRASPSSEVLQKLRALGYIK